MGESPYSVASSATTAKPAASAYSEVPTQAPASPGEMWYHCVMAVPTGGIIHLVRKARTKIITIAHTDTTAMPMAM